MHAPPLIHRCRPVVLLAGIIFLLLTGSWVSSDHVHLNHLLRVSYILIFCVGGYLLNPTRPWLKRYLLFGIPLAILASTEGLGSGSSLTAIIVNCLVLALQVHLFQAIFSHILFRENTTPLSKVLGGICGYLLLGLMFTNIYTVILIFDPKAILLNHHSTSNAGELMYYSLVTLTTLGYGDIVAISPTARILSALEAVAGNLYLAILISTLASQYLFKPNNRNSKSTS